MIIKQISLLFLLIISCFPSFAQVTTVQPSIMVVPYTKEGEDIRTVLEDDVNKRVVLTTIKEAFDQRGFSTVDFIGKLKARSNSAAFAENDQTDLKADIIENSGADIYVEAEIDINKGSRGSSVNIILNAYDTSTGTSLANKTGDSGYFYTDDMAKLASTAIRKNMDSFLNTLQDKFNQIIQNGRSITIRIGVDEGSDKLLDQEVEGTDNLLSEEIENWMEDNAYKNYYHIEGTTDKLIIFDDVRIPLKDERGRNYNINKFANAMQKFFNKINVPVTKSIKGNQIYISIQ